MSKYDVFLGFLEPRIADYRQKVLPYSYEHFCSCRVDYSIKSNLTLLWHLICTHKPATRHNDPSEGTTAQLQLELTNIKLHFWNCASQTTALCFLWQRKPSWGRIYLVTDRQQWAMSLEDNILAASFLLLRNSLLRSSVLHSAYQGNQ